MKSSWLFFLLLLPYALYAQILKPNFKNIERDLFKSSSLYNYEKLIFKYKVYPKSLDSVESQYLYYGRNFQKKTISTQDENFKVLAAFYKERKFTDCIRQGKILYEQDPTNLDVILILLKAYEEEKDYKNLLHHLSQLRILTDAMKNSGDGKSEKTAFLVNSVGDEYILLNMLNIGKNYTRSFKTLKDGVLDVWEEGDVKVFIKVLYFDLTN